MDAEMFNQTEEKVQNINDLELIDTSSRFIQNDQLFQQDTDKIEEENQLDQTDDQLFKDDTHYDSRRKSAPSQLKIKTRRQSKGIVYFNRKKPTIEITIGSLEEWYIENQFRFKRRKMNTFTEGEDQKEEYFDLEETRSKLNKSYLYENWQEDFEKERKKLESRNKKRKRSNSSRSRSKSPTPVSKKDDFQIQVNQNVVQRRGSVKGGSLKGSIKGDLSNSSQIDSEEEDRREAEKIKVDILDELNKKDEPMESQQLSTNLKYAQKYIEEALKCLFDNQLVKKKDIGKKSYYIAVNQESYLQFIQNKDLIKEKIQEIRDVEMQEQTIDSELNKLEKQIKDLKLKPTSEQIRQEIIAIMMEERLQKIVHIYKKRKDCCEDMLDYFSEHLNEDIDQIMRKCGIDPADRIISEDLAEILGIQLQRDNLSSDYQEEQSQSKTKKSRESVQDEVQNEENIDNE
ncbi:UNKNOWN [Stylonychia lemnae]|uniref:Uncharacterized protein n=1 Tax=Stylonychia lemnae TaxID=5949 RepID=A0A078A8A4_STYLE|nr:UNKNOWN [Stylonychia lemnae]|eukprot:CDW77807.1 UNKNOWN [Stylonychia lemnae]